VVWAAFSRTVETTPKAPEHWPAELAGTLEANREQQSKIILIISFQQELPIASAQAMQLELANIFEPLSIEPEWYRMEEAQGLTFPHRLIVVRFTGACAQPSETPVSHGALGHTHMTDGDILPFIEVNCDRVLGFIHHSASKQLLAIDEEVSGVALGRVLAHEIYHVVAGTARHGKTGVTREALTPDELTRGSSFIAGPESLLMIRTLRPPARQVHHLGRLVP
jgi:hypothetical protein